MNKTTLAMLATCIGLASCSSMKDKLAYEQAEPTINTILIPQLKCSCDDSNIPAAVQNAMISEFFKRSKVTVVKEGVADARIDGTITFSENQISAGNVGAFNYKTGSTSGKQVAGITLLVYRGDQLIATGGYAEKLVAGHVQPPEAMAIKSAQSLIRPLFAKGMQPKN